MAKDPAFLFYPNDFMSGTQFFTDEQVGKFMRVLMAQHQHGHLTEKQVIFITKSYDNDIFLKLEKDEKGNFYNKRLEEEIIKRKNYTESRGKNKLGKLKEKIISKSHDFDMENENENENTIVIQNEKSVENPTNETGQANGLASVQPIENLHHIHWPTSEQCEQYFQDKGSNTKKGREFFNYYKTLGWMISGKPIMYWRSKADQWIEDPNKFEKSETKKIEITPDDYAEIPKTSTHYARAN
jgi:hypothetical protein